MYFGERIVESKYLVLLLTTLGIQERIKRRSDWFASRRERDCYTERPQIIERLLKPIRLLKYGKSSKVVER